MLNEPSLTNETKQTRSTITFKGKYETKKGWGHTSMEEALEFGRLAQVRDLVFCHHDPERKDDEIDVLIGKYSELLGKEKGCPITNLYATKEKWSLKA